MVGRFRLSMPLGLSVLVAAVFVVAGMQVLAADWFQAQPDSEMQDQPTSLGAEADEPFAVETSWGDVIEVQAIATGSSQSGSASEGGPNEAQEGSGGPCLDYNVLYLVNSVESPLAVYVEVDPGSMYVIDSSGGKVFVDFHKEDGTWITWSALQHSGIVPDEAAYGIMCIGEIGDWPDVPHVWATWFYMDGFEPLSEDDD